MPAVLTAAGEPVPVPLKANWSDAAIRPVPPNAFCKLRVGALGVLVTVQLMTSPLAGVMLKGTLVTPVTTVPALKLLVQLALCAYLASVDVLPAAMISANVYVVPAAPENTPVEPVPDVTVAPEPVVVALVVLLTTVPPTPPVRIWTVN